MLEGEDTGFFGFDRIAGRELHATDLDLARNQLEPESPARPQVMRDDAAGLGLYAIDIRVLADVRRAFTSVVRDDQHLRCRQLLRRRLPLGVSWLKVRAIRHDPDLDEMKSIGLRRIVFAVLHAAPRAHHLDLPRDDLRVIAQAVPVFDDPLEDISEDLHVLVAMGRETHAGVHEVLINDPQRPEGHVGRIVVVGETEAMPGHQPAVIGEAAFLGASHCELHIRPK